MKKINNRRKGHNAERKYRLYFRNLGFKYCETSRFESRLLDNCKIDLTNLPFNLQIKAGYQVKLNPAKELYAMYQKVKENLDESFQNKFSFVLHELPINKGKKRTFKDTLIYFTLENFNNLNTNKNLKYSNLKIHTKLKIEENFKSIVSVNLKYFTDNILPLLN